MRRKASIWAWINIPKSRKREVSIRIYRPGVEPENKSELATPDDFRRYKLKEAIEEADRNGWISSEEVWARLAKRG